MIPAVMIVTPQSIHTTPPLTQKFSLGRLARAVLLCSATVMGCATAWAETTDPANHAALQQPAEIQLKLHPIEHLNDEPATKTDSAPNSDADEIRKQAQARYLAAKLKQKETTLRQYIDLAWAEADRRELAPELLIAIIQKESAFRPKVQSRYGAQGLMQVVHRWHREKLRPSETLFDPEVNIRVGADVLEEYLSLADGDLNHALRKYSGNARGYANTILKESRTLARIAEQAAAQTRPTQG